MRKTKRLVLSRERLRNLTPGQLGRALGGQFNNQSLNGLCNSLECNTLTLTNLTTDTTTNTATNTATNVLTNNLVDFWTA